MDDDIIEALAQKIEEAPGAGRVCAIIQMELSCLGIQNVCYYSTSTPGEEVTQPLVVTTYDPAWIDHYYERDYFLLDPVLSAGEKATLPFQWGTLAQSSEHAADFFSEARRFGVGCEGMTFPLHARTGETALLTLTSNRNSDDWKKSHFSLAHHCSFLAAFAHHRIMRLKGEGHEPPAPLLAGKEKEFLQYCADGLSPKQIAGKRNISATAVNATLSAIKRKMGCLTISQAVAHAIRNKLVT